MTKKDTLKYLELSKWDPKFAAIPKETGQFTAQKCLDISFNRIASIPQERLQWKNLECIDLSENQCLQALPSFLKNIPDLKSSNFWI